MFERFSAEGRQAVVAAQDAARDLDHGWIGCEHLLLGVAGQVGSPAAEALASLGAGAADLRAAVLDVVGRCVDPPDPDALLRVLGIDFEEVRRRAEEAFGPGALERTRAGRRLGGSGSIPFTGRAKEALELSLHAALARKDKAIGSEHVLLGILDQGGNVGLLVLDHLGVSPDTIRGALHDRLERDAA